MSSEAEIQCSKQNLEYEMIEYLVLQMKRLLTLLVAAMMLLLVASTGFAQSSAEGEAATETESQALDEDELLSNEEIEQLVAPIALHPDGLLSQILMASTYPLEVVEAARWVEANPDVEGDALETATADVGQKAP